MCRATPSPDPCTFFHSSRKLLAIVNINYEPTEFRLTALIPVRDRYEGTLSAGPALAFEKKFTFRSLRTRAFPAGVAPLRSPALVCGLILKPIYVKYIHF